MLFPTVLFLAVFAVVFTVYWSLSNHRHRLLWLLFASLYFYASWNLWLITLIVFSASVDYTVALILERVKTPWKRRALLVLSITTNLGLLAFFKYVIFFLATVNTVQGFFGVTPSRTFIDIVLPLGISFYTFETISYIVDVYQGKVKPVRNLLDYALYIMFFPHLVAGPIVRPRDFLPQIRRKKTWNWDRMQLGLQLFFLGLFKKAVLADHLAAIVDPIFKTPDAYGSSAVWLRVVGYAAPIYCDFSGFPDLAIRLAPLPRFPLPADFYMAYFLAHIPELLR